MAPETHQQGVWEISACSKDANAEQILKSALLAGFKVTEHTFHQCARAAILYENWWCIAVLAIAVLAA